MNHDPSNTVDSFERECPLFEQLVGDASWDLTDHHNRVSSSMTCSHHIRDF
jgi:hypothetical protein